jgi:phosphate transport system substrate-binding protein
MRRLFASLLLVACQGDPPPPPALAGEAVAAAEPGLLRLMGTGAMAPLAESWARAYSGMHIIVEPSVGSGGGVRAAADGAVDLGMVSRPLDDSELRLGLEMMPVAHDAVAIAAHRSVAVDGLSRAELATLYAGTKRFSDGSRAVLLMRDAQESANFALERVFPELTPLRQDAYHSARFRVLYHDDDMEQALAMTPGGVGVIGYGALIEKQLPLKALAIDGVRPTDEKWGALRPLAFVFRPDRRERVAAFLAFVASDEGRRIARESGFRP